MAFRVENENLLESRLGGEGVNLFLGAGFSVLAQDCDGVPLPLGSQLASELIREFDMGHLKDLGLGELCTVISLTQREPLREYLRRRFRVESFDERYLSLDALPISNIFTTNIDDLPHCIYRKSKRHYLNDIDMHGPRWRDKRGVDYFALHGSVLSDRRPLRFGSLETASSFGSDPDRWWYLKAQLCKWPTLFWGYSFEDAATLEALARVGTTNEDLEAWVLVYPDAQLGAALEYIHALGLQAIVGTTEEMLSFLQERQSHDAESAPHAGRVFTVPKSEEIPHPGATPTRPVEHFFRGASPTWSDVYSGLVGSLACSKSLEDAIAAGDNVIITGVPVCGKTTLLMQLAARVGFDGAKMMLDSPTKEKARLIIRQLGQEKALVFVDNATNDAESLRILINAPQTQVVAADRSYNLSIVYHILPFKKCNVCEISGLEKSEFQKLRDSIPAGIKTERMRIPEVTPGVQPSLYEFIEVNVSGPTLEERFRKAIREMRGKDADLLEMLLLVSYVHSCRTPVSMDMALAYWRGRIPSYKGIYALMEDAGKLVHEYYGSLADEAQDYYMARSVMVANTVLEAADRESFRSMLTTFHKNVSLTRICHYEVFRRRAFDARRVARRAFSRWEDARDFYEAAYARDPNPYIRQQEAIFLGTADRYTEAFQVIEQALAESGTSNWTIRNTYAILLFRRNIDFAGDSVARQSLVESMETLERCYSSDRRKGFHAKTFADHALQFWRAYHDGEAERYLRLAAEWLAEAAGHEPWDRDIPHLLEAVRDVRV